MPQVKSEISSPTNIRILINVIAALSDRPCDAVRDHVLDAVLSYAFFYYLTEIFYESKVALALTRKLK